jgi:hypothetical protein
VRLQLNRRKPGRGRRPEAFQKRTVGKQERKVGGKSRHQPSSFCADMIV